MIRYNNKFLNVATFLLLLYILYSAKQHEPRFLSNLAVGRGNYHAQDISTHSMVLDPQKPDSQKTWPEWVVSYMFKDKIQAAINQKANYKTANKYGDKVVYLYEVTASNKSRDFKASLDYVVGVTQAADYISHRLRDAKVGDVFDFEIEDSDGKNKIHIEVQEIVKSTL